MTQQQKNTTTAVIIVSAVALGAWLALRNPAATVALKPDTKPVNIEFTSTADGQQLKVGDYTFLTKAGAITKAGNSTAHAIATSRLHSGSGAET